MVKQGFKNKSVIGMSAAAAGCRAKLLHQAINRAEREREREDLLE